MTPKEKAQELYLKANEIFGYHEYHISDDSKNICLLTINEVLNARKVGDTGVVLDESYWRYIQN